MQTFKIDNQAFYSIFSMENDTCPTPVQVNHRISSKIIRNLQIIERIIYDKGLTYTWIAFSRKFDSIKLQTFKFVSDEKDIFAK